MHSFRSGIQRNCSLILWILAALVLILLFYSHQATATVFPGFKMVCPAMKSCGQTITGMAVRNGKVVQSSQNGLIEQPILVEEAEKVPEKPIVDEKEVFESRLFMLINQYRVKNHLKPWEKDAILALSADMKAEKMDNDGYFGHTLPGKPANYFMNEFLEAGYPAVQQGFYSKLGENLACGYDTPEQVLKAWQESAAHNQLLLSTSYYEAGIGSHWFIGTGLKGVNWDCLAVVLHTGGIGKIRASN